MSVLSAEWTGPAVLARLVAEGELAFEGDDRSRTALRVLAHRIKKDLPDGKSLTTTAKGGTMIIRLVDAAEARTFSKSTKRSETTSLVSPVPVASSPSTPDDSHQVEPNFKAPKGRRQKEDAALQEAVADEVAKKVRNRRSDRHTSAPGSLPPDAWLRFTDGMIVDPSTCPQNNHAKRHWVLGPEVEGGGPNATCLCAANDPYDEDEVSTEVGRAVEVNA